VVCVFGKGGRREQGRGGVGAREKEREDERGGEVGGTDHRAAIGDRCSCVDVNSQLCMS